MPLRWGIAPMKAVSSDSVPTDDGWEFEIKWDGNRNFAFVEDGAVRFQTSHKLDSTARFAALSSLPDGVNAKQAILDGEVVILDPAGRPSFSLLQQGEGALLYVIFDVLQIDGHDVTGLAYSDRRKLLEQLVDNGDRWMVSPRHADGNALYEAAKERGLEGVMAKRVDSVYEPGRRSPAWRKIKYRPQQEFVVGGWVPGGGTRGSTFAALLVGCVQREEAAVLRAGRHGLQGARAAAAARSLSWARVGRLPVRSPAATTHAQDRPLAAARDGGRGRSSPSGRATASSASPPTWESATTRTPARSSARSDVRDRSGQRPVWPKPPPRFSPSSVSTSRNAHGFDPLDDELGDAVAPVHLVGLGRVGVDEQHLQLVAVAGVDEARRVEAR